MMIDYVFIVSEYFYGRCHREICATFSEESAKKKIEELNKQSPFCMYSYQKVKVEDGSRESSFDVLP